MQTNEKRLFTFCLCVDQQTQKEILFVSTGYQVIYEGRLNTFKTINIGIIENGYVYNQCIEEFKLSSVYDLEKGMNNISLTHHMRYSGLGELKPIFQTQKKEITTNLYRGMQIIVDDLFEEEDKIMMKENVYNQLAILIASDATPDERKNIIYFIKHLDLFKYGEQNHYKRFRSRCICFITCLSVFLEERLDGDLFDTFNTQNDRYIELLLNKLFLLTKETIPKKVNSPRYILRVPSNEKDITTSQK